jgi:hypothetical protein
MIPDHIQCDAVQPCLNAAISAKTLPRAVGLHKGVLHDRFGQISVSERKSHKAKQAGAISLYQLVNVIQLRGGTRLDWEANEVRGMGCIHILIDGNSSKPITPSAPGPMDRGFWAQTAEIRPFQKLHPAAFGEPTVLLRFRSWGHPIRISASRKLRENLTVWFQ